MPSPDRIVLNFEHPTATLPAETELELFERIVSNPKSSNFLVSSYLAELKECDVTHPEFMLFKNIKVGHNARTCSPQTPIWHTDAPKDVPLTTALNILSGSTTTKTAECRILIDLKAITNEEYLRRFKKLRSRSKTAEDVLSAVYAIGYILGDLWIDKARDTRQQGEPQQRLWQDILGHPIEVIDLVMNL